jgi:hypothetical protein
MRHFCSIVFVALTLASGSALAEQPPTFPPLGERYGSPSAEVKAVVNALNRLQAQTESPINLVEYSQAVNAVIPDAKVFIGSAEAREMPELRMMIANATGCFAKVQSLWSDSVISDDPLWKYEAATLLLTAKPALWKTAAANLSGAKAFVEGPDADRLRAQEVLIGNAEALTLEAGLQLAEQQLVAIERAGRAKESGVAVPEDIADEDRKDLQSLLFQEGDFGDSVTAGEIKNRLPGVFGKVPPAMQEGRVSLLESGKSAGGVAGLIYPDVKTAQLAVDAVASGYGSTKQRVSDLGDAAVGSQGNGLGAVSLVFRRGPMVVAMQSPVTPLAKTVEAARRLDERIAAIFPSDGKPMPPAVETGGVAESLADALFQEGDFGDEVSAGAFREQVPFMFSEVPPANEQGYVPLTNLGDQVGGIAAFVYASEKEANAGLAKIASGIGRQGSKVPGVGNAAYASRAPTAGSQDIVFRRDETVVHLRAPSKKLADITKAAKKVDSRIQKMKPARVAPE